MSIEIIPINGKTDFIDYEVFEASAKTTIGKKCSDAKIFLLNKFPAPVSVETNIDLILILAIEDKQGNYYIPKFIKNRPIYFHNQIIPISFVNQYEDSTLSIDDKKQLIADEEFIDYSSEINSMKFSLISYLSNRCGFNKQDLYVQPLIWIKNKTEIFHDNYLSSEVFDFKALTQYFKWNSQNIFIAYKAWKTQFGYRTINEDIKRITDQASKDSKIGYLTKKKVDRIGRQLSSSKKIFDELNQNLIIVEGKAGTGKSSELLLLTMKCISKGQNTLYLTYNKLLIFDIAKTVRSYANDKLYDERSDKPGESSVLSLQAFFFRLSRSLGVLHVLNADRIQELLDVLDKRLKKIHDLLFQKTRSESIDFDKIKSTIQNHPEFDVGTKEVGIDFVNFLKFKRYNKKIDFNEVRQEFFKRKEFIVSNIGANEAFIANYYWVLENTLLQIRSPEKFYEEYNVEDKHELLDIAIGLSEKYEDEKDGKKIITEKGFIEFKNRSVGGHRRKRTLFIDEAQDCHRLEREILISIYGSNNIVVAYGGKEQLIRHVKLCDWEVFNARKLPVKKHYTRNKTYRVKKTVVEFCNYVAKHFGINLNLEPFESEDEGELLIDFRQYHDSHQVSDILNLLNTKGEVNDCTPYESLMVLLESSSQSEKQNKKNSQNKESVIINEYDNIENAKHFERITWKHKDKIEHDNLMFWDGTVEDKTQLIVPGPNQSRLLYYESCRGLESWSVACFDIDKFFSRKRKDPDAEKFLIEDPLLNQDNEHRKNMYAATWALMALTRVIDTLYIQINDRNSEFGKVVVEYVKLKNKNVRELK